MQFPGDFMKLGFIVGSGLLFNWRSSQMKDGSDLNKVLQATEQLFDELAKKNLNYCLVGGVALLHYIEGRNTQDIDLIMSKTGAEAIGLAVNSRNNDFIFAEYAGLRVDVLLTNNKLFDLVLKEHSSVINFQGREIRAATPLGLVGLKLFALPSLYRQGQIERAAIYETDIFQLLNSCGVNTDAALSLVKPHVSYSDYVELSNVISELIEKMQRRRF